MYETLARKAARLRAETEEELQRLEAEFNRRAAARLRGSVPITPIQRPTLAEVTNELAEVLWFRD